MKYVTRAINRGIDRETSVRPLSMDKSSGTSEDSQYGNTVTYNGAELRALRIMYPYGYVAGMPNDILCQTIMNGSVDGVIASMFDEGRPNVNIGEAMLYSAFGSSVHLRSDGTIAIKDTNGTIDVKYVVDLYNAHIKLKGDYDSLLKRVETLEGRI